MPGADDPLAWARLAREDLAIGTRLAGDDTPGAARVACFLAQQAAEKAVKGLLTSAGVPVRRTHDVAALLRNVLERQPSLVHLAADCDLLADFAVDVRYPDDLGSPPGAIEAREAMAAATRVCAGVLPLYAAGGDA